MKFKISKMICYILVEIIAAVVVVVGDVVVVLVLVSIKCNFVIVEKFFYK